MKKIGVALFTLVLILFLSACSSGKAQQLNDGPLAPSFELKDYDGNSVKLSDFEGKRVYIRFWASWCPYCVQSLEEFEEISEAENDFAVLSIVSPNYKNEKNETDFRAWYDKIKTELKLDDSIILIDEGGKYTQEIGIRSYPTNFFIGSDGIAIGVISGAVPNETIYKALERIQ